MTDRPDRPALLRRLERLPRLGVFLGALVVGLAAFFAPGWIGAVLTGLFATGVGVLLLATWHHRTPGERVLRLLLLGVLVVITVSKIT